ncbi:putative dipeptidyl-aminopeptidase B, partial [Smittium culicis]
NTPKDETNAEEQYISFNEYNAGSYVSNLDDITYVKHPENATIDGLYISEEDDIKIVNIEETFEHILATKSDISSALVAASLGNDTSFISITASPDWKFLLLETDRVKIFRHSYYSTYYVYSVDTKKMTPLSNTLNDRVTLAQFSPVGHSISFVIENDLYTSDMSKINRVTTSGGVNVFNAISDWVYEEEVFGSSYAHWWSPDGTKILFLQTNDTFVTEYKYSLYNPNSANNSYPEEQSIKFPKAGYSNPTPQVFVHDLSSAGNSLQYLDFGSDEFVVTQVEWVTKDSSNVIVRLANRIQNTFKTYLVSNSGSSYTHKMVNEVSSVKTDNAWIEISNSIVYISKENTGSGSDGYLDLVEYNGFMHIGLYTPLDNNKPIMLTQGNWEVVDRSLSYDSNTNIVYYQATTRASYAFDIYSLNVSGYRTVNSLTPVKNLPDGVTGSGSYGFTLSSNGLYGTLTYNGPDVPWNAVYKLKSGQIDGAPVHIIGTNKDLREKLSKMDTPRIEFTSVPSEPGYDDLDVSILYPPCFDPSVKKHYSVLVNYYGGPNSKQVSENYYMSTWNAAAVSAIHANTEHPNAVDLVVITIDPRGTAYKGRKFSRIVDRKLGVIEAYDIAKATRYLLNKYDYLDPNRVGAWGWSYGGFLTLKLLEEAPELFKVGMSVAPVTDWRFYDTVYTERYMDTPQMNPAGYNISTVHNYTNIASTNLLLMHGTGDDNVHPQNSFVLIDKLQTVNDHNLTIMLYPDSDHSIRLGNARPYLNYKLANYLFTNFQ